DPRRRDRGGLAHPGIAHAHRRAPAPPQPLASRGGPVHRYRLAYAGPGGTLTTTLRLVAPREGVLRRARVVRSRGSARAVFTFAALPTRSLGTRSRPSCAASSGTTCWWSRRSATCRSSARPPTCS